MPVIPTTLSLRGLEQVRSFALEVGRRGLLVLPFLLWVAHRFVPFSCADRLLRGYTLACVVLVSFITVADLHAYREFGAKLNAQTLAYLRYPKEALASVSSSQGALLNALL